MGRRTTVSAINGNPSPSSSSSSTTTTTTTTESSFRELDDVFLQTQTRIWLGEVLHTRLDDHLNISDLLADGELLLEVSKILWTLLISKCKELENVKGHKYNPAGSRKSSGRYRPYSNVDSFLKMCKILGLSGIDLFSPSDVVEKRDTRKVCICLRSLSKKARSKQLKVADFDIVTYTVAMPTNMVGYLRKSLEPSEKNMVATSDRNYDSYSEASDEAESNYMGGKPHCSPTNHSRDATWKDLGFKNPPGVSSVVKNYTLALSASQEGVHDEDENIYRRGDGESARVDGNSMSPPSVDSRLIFTGKSPLHNGRFRRGIQEMGELDLTDAESAIEDYDFLGGSSDEKTVERLYVCSRSTFPDLLDFGGDEENPFHIEGEDSAFSLLLGTDSHGSNSTGRISVNGFGRRSFDDFEDVEVSSVTSLSSVLGRALDLDFDDQIDVEDSETITDLHRTETSSDYSEVSNCKTELEKFDCSTPLPLPCPNNFEPQTKDYQDFLGAFDCGVSPCQKSSGYLKPNVVDGDPDDGIKSSGGGVERSGLDHHHHHHKDENSHEIVESLEKLSESRESVNPRPSPGAKPHRSPLMRTVIKGTALFGMFLLLLQLRWNHVDSNRTLELKNTKDVRAKRSHTLD